MTEYNPKNPDAFKQETLPEPAPLPLNITPVPEGSIVERGDLSSPNFREGRAGWRIRSTGDAEFNDAIVRGTIQIGGEYITVKTTDSIQEAIDKVHLEGGGTVVLENGVHTVTSDIIMYSNTTLQGQNRSSSIINFGGTSSSIVAQGSNIYSTGTVTVANNSQTVTGNGTAWLTNATAGMSIMLGGIWYPITVVGGDGSITIAIPYAGTALTTEAYVLGVPIYNVYVKDLTVYNSSDSGIKFYYFNNGGTANVDTTACLVGWDFNYTAQCQLMQMTGSANYTNFKLFNTHYLAFWSAGAIDALNGHGFELDTVTNSKLDSLFILNATGDGMNIKNCKNLLLNAVVSKENTGSGIEFVSGNDMIVFAGCGVENNGDSGLKLTATSDNIFIQNSLLKGNTGYGVNIVASTCDNVIITGNNFSGNTTNAVNDSGTGTVIRGNVGVSDNSTNQGASFDYQVFTSDGTWTKPSNATANSMVTVVAWGAGGAGGGATTNNYAGGGGGGGAYNEFKFRASDLSSTVSVTVGSGGTGGTGNGPVGGNTSFGSYVLAYGGGGGAGNRDTSGTGSGGGGGGGIASAGSSSTDGTGATGGSPAGSTSGVSNSGFGGGGGNNGGLGTAGMSAYGGAGGGGGAATGNVNAGNGGSCVYGGGGGGGGAPGGTGGTGGTSTFGGAGGTGANGNANGTAGTAPGGGGGGAGSDGTSRTGGSGARGEVRVWTIF